MSSQRPIRFALVGAGAIAQSYAQAFATATSAQLVAVVDVRAAAAEELARRLECRAFENWETAQAAVAFDAAIVCTPPQTHGSVSIGLLEHGVHVLCEKPLAIDTATASRMFEAAKRSGTVLTMASKFRYTADVAEAKRLLGAGAIGDILQFENTFASPVDMSQRWNSNPSVSGGGVLIDNGTHSVDIVRYLLGPICDVQAVALPRLQPLDVEDAAVLFARTEAGIGAKIDLSWSLAKEEPCYVRVYGTEGTLLVGWKEAKYRRTGQAEWTSFGNGYNKVQAFAAQLENFTSALRGREPLRVTPRDAMASVEVIEAAYDSLEDSQWRSIRPAAHTAHFDIPVMLVPKGSAS